MDEKELAKHFMHALDKIGFEFWWITFKIFLVIIIIIYLKNVVLTIVGYFVLRANKHISIGVPVIIDGYDGIIRKISLTHLVIENSNGYYVVPMTEAYKKRWFYKKMPNCTLCNPMASSNNINKGVEDNSYAD